MKEYKSQKGGRYTYIDDITNLQDLALSITSLFEGCGNFIISGCEVIDGEMTPGYVYLNGKIRYCEEYHPVQPKDILYIYEENRYENVSYVDSGDNVGRISFGCVVATRPKQVPDDVTNMMPQYITMNMGQPDSIRRIKDAFFGKYAILLDHESGGQKVTNNLHINGTLLVEKSITSHEHLDVERNDGHIQVGVDEHGNAVVQNMGNNPAKAKLVITSDGKFVFYSGSAKIAEMNADGSNFKTSVSSDIVKAGSSAMYGNCIANRDSASDSGELNINLRGYNDRNDYFRITNIGDGKGNVVLSINGKRKVGVLNGKLLVKSPEIEAIEINASKAGSNPELQNYMIWKDVNGAHLMKLGYLSLKDNSFYISNSVGSVTITSDCNVSGTLRVQGKDIMETLVVNSNYKKDMDLKADKTNVYSKEDADNRFLKLSGEFTELVNHIGGDKKAAQKKLRQQIDAVGNETVPEFAHNAECLADVVFYGIPREPYPEHEQEMSRLQAVLNRQEDICKNIGAVLVNNPMVTATSEEKISLDGSQFKQESELYIRRCGRIILIQGTITPAKPMNQYVAFTLPPQFQTPKHRVTQRYYYHDHRMSCSIGGKFGNKFTIDHDGSTAMYVSMMYIID